MQEHSWLSDEAQLLRFQDMSLDDLAVIHPLLHARATDPDFHEQVTRAATAVTHDPTAWGQAAGIHNDLRFHPARLHLQITMGAFERKHSAVCRACLLHRTLVNCHYLCLTHDQAALFICLIPPYAMPCFSVITMIRKLI